MASVAAVGLTLVAVLADLETAERAASVVGAVVGLIGVVVSVVALTRPAGGGRGHRVQAGRGGIAAGGDVIGNAIGDRSQVSGSRTPASPAGPHRGQGDVRAGRDGIAVGGDIIDNSIGDDSQR